MAEIDVGELITEDPKTIKRYLPPQIVDGTSSVLQFTNGAKTGSPFIAYPAEVASMVYIENNTLDIAVDPDLSTRVYSPINMGLKLEAGTLDVCFILTFIFSSTKLPAFIGTYTYEHSHVYRYSSRHPETYQNQTFMLNGDLTDGGGSTSYNITVDHLGNGVATFNTSTFNPVVNINQTLPMVNIGSDEPHAFSENFYSTLVYALLPNYYAIAVETRFRRANCGEWIHGDSVDDFVQFGGHAE